MNKKKHKGNVILLVLIITAIISIGSVGLWIVACTMENQEIQDSLQLSQIACYSEIDKKSLGNDGEFKIFNDPQGTYDKFKKTLKKNLNLNDDYTRKSGITVKGKIKIQEFIIYNVSGNLVDIYKFSSSGIFTKTTNDLSNKIYTPNGYEIKETTIHTSLMYDVDYFVDVAENKTVSVDTDILKE